VKGLNDWPDRLAPLTDRSFRDFGDHVTKGSCPGMRHSSYGFAKEREMKTNMGKIDRGLRLGAAAVLLFAAFGTTVAGSGVLFWVALAVAATALVGNCPAYSVIGLKTCRDC
jgi:hypothetical protein